jgi:rhodanese-related sulfurtransferase
MIPHKEPAMPAATIQEIEPAAANQLIASGQAALIDVREEDEYARERIPGATLAPLSRFDPASIPADRAVIFHCRTGRRSMDAAQRVAGRSQGDIYNLQGGIVAWRAAGLPIQEDRKMPLPIMRQVQITAGGVVLLGSILAVTVSPWFLLVVGFFGAGLLFAGLTGTCGMASMLAVMPWNRRST